MFKTSRHILLVKTSRNLPGWRRAKVVVGTKVCQVLGFFARITVVDWMLDPTEWKHPKFTSYLLFSAFYILRRNLLKNKVAVGTVSISDKQKYLKQRLSKTSQVFNFSWTHSCTIINVEISKNELTSCHGNQLVPYGRLMARAAWRIEIVAMKPAWMMMMA